MSEATPRVNAKYLGSFTNQIVRILGRVVSLRGETATIDANGSITVHLNRVSGPKTVRSDKLQRQESRGTLHGKRGDETGWKERNDETLESIFERRQWLTTSTGRTPPTQQRCRSGGQSAARPEHQSIPSDGFRQQHRYEHDHLLAQRQTLVQRDDGWLTGYVRCRFQCGRGRRGCHPPIQRDLL